MRCTIPTQTVKIWCMESCMLARDGCCAGSKFEACRTSAHRAMRLTCTEGQCCGAGGKCVIHVQTTGEQASLSTSAIVHEHYIVLWLLFMACIFTRFSHQVLNRLYCWRPDSLWIWCFVKASASSRSAQLQLCSSAHHG